MIIICAFVGVKENKVFVDNFSKLSTILKLSFRTLAPFFVTEQLLSPTEVDVEAEHFLKNIAISLKSGTTTKFYTMLNIMKQHGNLPDEELAIAMENALK